MPKTGGKVVWDAFFQPLLGPVMTRNEPKMLTEILNLKPPIFLGAKTKDAYEFILNYYASMCILVSIHKHWVKFVSFELKVDKK